MSNDWVLLFMLAAGLGGIVFVMRRFAGTPPVQNNYAIEQLEEKLERVSRDMRYEISENLRGNRQEMSQSMHELDEKFTK